MPSIVRTSPTERTGAVSTVLMVYVLPAGTPSSTIFVVSPTVTLTLAAAGPVTTPLPSTSVRLPSEPISTLVSSPESPSFTIPLIVAPSFPETLASAGMMAVAFPSSAFPRAKLSLAFPVNVALPILTEALEPVPAASRVSVPAEMSTVYAVLLLVAKSSVPLPTAAAIEPAELPFPETRVAFPFKSSICASSEAAVTEFPPPETVAPFTSFTLLVDPAVPFSRRSMFFVSSSVADMANVVPALTAV